MIIAFSSNQHLYTRLQTSHQKENHPQAQVTLQHIIYFGRINLPQHTKLIPPPGIFNHQPARHLGAVVALRTKRPPRSRSCQLKGRPRWLATAEPAMDGWGLDGCGDVMDFVGGITTQICFWENGWMLQI